MKRRLIAVCLLIICLVTGQTGIGFAASTSDKPKAPVMNSAIYAEDGSIDVVWAKVSGADKYEIYRATSRTGKFIKIAEIGGKNTVFNDSDVKLYKTYYYKVKTVDGSKQSAYSKIVSVYAEGPFLKSEKMKFHVTFEGGEKHLGNGCYGTTTTSPFLKCTFQYNGKAVDDYELYYDKTNVKIVREKNGKLTITPKAAGYHLITFAKDGEKGSFVYNAEKLEYGNVTFTWKQDDGNHDSMSVKIPDQAVTVLTIRHNGKKINDYKVSVSNKRICTVIKDGSKLTITNKSPGKCKIIITYKGKKNIFHWISKGGRTTEEYQGVTSRELKEANTPAINSVIYGEDGTVDVIWKTVADAKKYEIYRATSKKGTYKRLATVGKNVFSFNDAAVEDYKNYYYKIKAVRKNNKTESSEIVSVYTQGKLLYDNSLQFKVAWPDGANQLLETTHNIATSKTKLSIAVLKNGKPVSDYKLYCDKERLHPVKQKDGTTAINPDAKGDFLITVEAGDAVGSMMFYFDAGNGSNIQILWKERREVGISNDRILEPEFQKTRYSVLDEKGNVIKDYTVTSSDSRICSVDREGNAFLLTNHSPGVCQISIKYKGITTKYDVLVRRGSATEPINCIDGIYADDSITAEKDKNTVRKFVEPQYTRAEIREMVKADLTLEEAAERISTVQDAVNYMRERGYHNDYSYNPGMEYKGHGWSWTLSAEFTFEHNAGTCGGTSSLLNRLLKGDYDSQGYVMEMGHVHNYFYEDGIYFFCDFADLGWYVAVNYKDERADVTPGYIQFAAKDMKEYAWYRHLRWPDYANLESPDYRPFIFAYPLDGEKNLPIGDVIDFTAKVAYCTVLPDVIKDTVNFIHLLEGISFEYAEAPTPDKHPPEVNIPKD